MKTTRFLIALLSAIVTGCQSYEPMILDLGATDDAIARRDIGGENAAAFAERLRALNVESHAHFDPSDGVSLGEAEAIALMFNPKLRAARLAAKVPLASAHEAGQWDDPELDFDMLRLTRGGDNPWIVGGSLKFTIPLSGRLPYEKAVAFGQANQAWREVLAKEWRLIIQLRQAWLRWSRTRQHIALIDSHLSDLDTVYDLAAKQREFNRISVTDLRVLELDRLNMRGQRASLEATSTQQTMMIKSLLGVKSDAMLLLQPALNIRAPSPSVSEQVTQLREDNVDLAITRSAFDAADRVLQLELRKQYPDLHIGPALENEEGASRVGVAFSVPIPIFNANRRAIAEANAARVAAKAAHDAQYEILRGELDRARLAVETAGTRKAFLEQQVAPVVDKQLADLRKLASLGDLDVIVLLDALTRRFETKRDILTAQSAQSDAAIHVQALLRPVVTPTALQRPDASPSSINEN